LIYPPSEKTLKERQEEAKNAGKSTSNYIIEMIERGMRSDSAVSRSDLSKENAELKGEVRKLKNRYTSKEIMCDNIDTRV
jgi:hypothetical protein